MSRARTFAHLATASMLSLVLWTGWTTPASANPEPTLYDARSVGLGLTGVTFLDAPSALAINPANLQSIENWGGTVAFAPLYAVLDAPASGPGSSNTAAGFAPLGALFAAGRVSRNVVLGTGIYIETGFGGGFSNVTTLDGEPSNTEPVDLDVTFFVAEAALAASFQLSDNFKFGIAIRVPFSKQIADLVQNIAPALGQQGIAYERVQLDMGGVGRPTPRIGFNWEVTPQVRVGASYRAAARIPLDGTVDALGDVGPADSSWRLPHALQFGGDIRLLDNKLMLVSEIRMQFHDAGRSGNDSQVVRGVILGIERTIRVPFDWRTVVNGKVGVQYSVSDLVDLRAGFNAGNSATRAPFAQLFTPPAGVALAGFLGLGLNWTKVSFDLSFAVAGGRDRVTREDSQPVIFQGEALNLCHPDQVTRTGCPGVYRVAAYFGTLSVTFRL